jgi:hypothetical protein
MHANKLFLSSLYSISKPTQNPKKKKKERKGIGTERKCDGIGRRKVKHYHTMHSLHKSFELLKVVSLHENRAKPEIGKDR